MQAQSHASVSPPVIQSVAAPRGAAWWGEGSWGDGCSGTLGVWSAHLPPPFRHPTTARTPPRKAARPCSPGSAPCSRSPRSSWERLDLGRGRGRSWAWSSTGSEPTGPISRRRLRAQRPPARTALPAQTQPWHRLNPQVHGQLPRKRFSTPRAERSAHPHASRQHKTIRCHLARKRQAAPHGLSPAPEGN